MKIQTGTENEILRKKSVPVQKVTKKILKLLKGMEDTLKKEDGLGLAGPQVGENVRVILVRIDKKMIIPMVNPEITSRSDETDVCEEGCLSLPKQYFDVERASEITVKFLDPKGAKHILKLAKLNARVIQHEVDHLDGILIADY